MSNLDKLAEGIREMLPSEDELKKSFSEDKKFIEKLSVTVAEQLISKGYIDDRLLTLTQTLEVLGLKNRSILLKLRDNKKNPLVPVKIHENAHPKWRLSDINRYIGNLQKR